MVQHSQDPIEARYTNPTCHPQPWPANGVICDYRFTVTTRETAVARWEMSFRLAGGTAHLYVNPGENPWYEVVDTRDHVAAEEAAGRRFVLRAKPGNRIEPGRGLRVDLRLLYRGPQHTDQVDLHELHVTECR